MLRQCKWTSVNRFSWLKLKNLLEAHDVVSCCTVLHQYKVIALTTPVKSGEPLVYEWWETGTKRATPRSLGNCWGATHSEGEGEWCYTLLWCEMFKLGTCTRIIRRAALWAMLVCSHWNCKEQQIRSLRRRWRVKQTRAQSFSATLALWKCQ